MKSKFTLFILLIFSTWSITTGQITLTESNIPHSPSFQDTVRIVQQIDFPFEIEGEDMEYDFSAYLIDFGYVPEFFPVNRPDFSNYTRYEFGAAFLGPLSFTSEYYTHKDSIGVSEVGSYKIAESVSLEPISGNPTDNLVFSGNNSIFNSPNYVLKFPTSHGSSWSSEGVFTTDFSTTIAGFGLSNVPSQQVQYNLYEYEQVGWGQLILPTVNGPSIPYDVIVIKEVNTMVDSIFLGGAPAPEALLNGLGTTQGAISISTRYRFYTAGFETHLLYFNLSQDLQSIESAEYGSVGILTAEQPIYVDVDAAAVGDGKSWATAYNNLNTAIENASINDEIWVAEGLYRPDVPSVSPDPTKRMFLLWQDVELYGGFNGTETNRSERNPSLYETILSGDINGDDVENEYSINRGDNVENVVYGNTTISTECILDGFTISGGQADGDVSILSDTRGAGMFTFGPLLTRNCKFEQNYALNHGGGAYYRDGAASGGKVINCTFRRNGAGMNGGGLFAAFVPGEGVVIDSSTFTNNVAGESGGGFIAVQAHCIITNSIFSFNEVTENGGGINLSNSFDPEVANCIFSNNTAGNGGGGAQFSTLSPNQTTIITNCEFNSNRGASGAGLNCQGSDANSNFVIDGCIAIGNTSQGALATGAGIDISYGNFAAGGTAIVTNCRIQDNSIDGSGGGIALRDQSVGDNEMIVRNCNILGNTATFSAGGLLFYKASASNTRVQISQSKFSNNSSSGALAIGSLSLVDFNPDQSFIIDNNIFRGHNGPSANTSVIRLESMNGDLINNTIIGEATGLSGNESTQYNIQNNIIYTPNFATILNPGGNTSYISRGGNLFSDDLASSWAQPEDQQSSDPIFEGGSTYLSENSPAVDMGILPELGSLVDVDSLDRVQGSCIDIGARESVFDASIISCLVATSIKGEIISADGLEIFPNPVNAISQIRLENEWIGKLNIRILNSLGQVVQKYSVEKKNDIETWPLSTQHLENGMYQIILSDGQQIATLPFLIMK